MADNISPEEEDTVLTAEEEAFFARMPPEFFEELKRRAELAKLGPGLSVEEHRLRVKRHAKNASV